MRYRNDMSMCCSIIANTAFASPNRVSTSKAVRTLTRGKRKDVYCSTVQMSRASAMKATLRVASC